MLRWYRATPPPAIDTTWPHQFFTMKKFMFLDDFYVYLLRIELKLNELIRNLFSFFRFQVCSSVNRNFHENRMRHENNAHHHNHQTLLLKQIGRAGRGSAPHPQASASNSLGTIHILSIITFVLWEERGERFVKKCPKTLGADDTENFLIMFRVATCTYLKIKKNIWRFKISYKARSSQYFWKWTIANPMKIFGELATHPKF